MMVNGIHGWLHVSLGRADRYLSWGIIEWVATVALFFAGLPWGPRGIAVAWGVSFWALTVPALVYGGKPIGLTLGPVMGAMWRYVAAALAAGGTLGWGLAHISWLSGAEGMRGALARIAIDSAAFAGVYIAAVVVLHGGAAPLRQVRKLMGELQGRKPAGPAVPA
jgi:PST family polysaccharide transporter